MDGALIPWWMAILLGIGAVGLGLWQSPGRSPSVRLGGGILGLVYLLLLAYVLCTESRGGAALTWTQRHILQGVLGALSLIAAVMLAGSPTDQGRGFWFGLFCVLNAALAGLAQATVVAFLLGVLGLVCLAASVLAMIRGALTPRDLVPGNVTALGKIPTVVVGLAAVAGFSVALAVLATGRYAGQVESSRPTTTRRLSRFPDRDRVRSVLSLDADRERVVLLGEVWRPRGEVLVLMGGLLGLALLSAVRPTLPDAVPAADVADTNSEDS